jgi:hypothetical protein
METIFEYIILLQLSVCKVKGQFMRYLLIFVFNFILIPTILGQASTEVLDSKLSPKGEIELQFTDNDSCICMDAWLISKEDTTQRFMLDSAITLGTKYFFSPDEKWIAANYEALSNLREILLYKRIGGIKFSRVDNINIFEKACAFLSKKKHLSYIPQFGHEYAQIIRWLPSSESFLVRIDGWDNDHGISVKDWTCIFNVNSLSISEDKHNLGKVFHSQ